MNKRKRTSSTGGCRRRIRAAGLSAVGVFVALMVMVSGNPPRSSTAATATSRPDVRPSPTTEVVGVTIIPTEVVNRAALVATATITDTVEPSIIPSITMVPQMTLTPMPDVQALDPSTYYVTRDSNVRSCPNTTCEKLGMISTGTNITVTGSTIGEEVSAGNGVWYEVQYGARLGYVYSPALTTKAPSAPIRIVPTQAPVASGYTGPIPKNCTEARNMGIDQYTAARINPNLDRDKDGKACYDDN